MKNIFKYLLAFMLVLSMSNISVMAVEEMTNEESGNSITIGENSYGSIQAAIDAAEEGATILVGPGTYSESNISVRKKGIIIRSIYGAEDTIINATGTTRNAILIEAEDVTIEGFKIINWGQVGTTGGSSNRRAIVAGAGSSNVIISNNIIEYNDEQNRQSNGIVSELNTGEVTIANNTILGIKYTIGGESLDAWKGTGIGVWGAQNVNIQNNDLFGVELAIGLYGHKTIETKDIVIRENKFEDSQRTHVHINPRWDSGVAIDSVIIEDNEFGMVQSYYIEMQEKAENAHYLLTLDILLNNNDFKNKEVHGYYFNFSDGVRASTIIERNDVVDVIESAITYEYSDYAYNYNYLPTLFNGGIHLEYKTSDLVEYNEQDPNQAILHDLARYFGALYRTPTNTQEEDKVISSITYNGTIYEWSPDFALLGSNWVPNISLSGVSSPSTLVEAVAQDFMDGHIDSEVEFYLNGSVRLILSFEVNDYFGVEFIDYDDQLLKTEEVKSGTSATPPADPTREGHTFTGWDVAFDNVTDNLVVTAEYEINTYTVTFNDYDGTKIEDVTVDHGSDATPPADPTREGHTFNGWNAIFSNVTSDLTIVATYLSKVVEADTKDFPKLEVEGLDDLDKLGITFTDEEKEKDVSVIVVLELLKDEDVPKADKDLLDAYLEANANIDSPMSLLLDISMLKIVGDSASAINELASPITISFEVPFAFRNIDFELLRVHDGKVESLDYDYNAETFILTFETDKFSTYALAEVAVESEDETDPVEEEDETDQVEEDEKETVIEDDDDEEEEKETLVPDMSDNGFRNIAYVSMLLGSLLVLLGSKRKLFAKLTK
mgnify:FL=1